MTTTFGAFKRSSLSSRTRPLAGRTEPTDNSAYVRRAPDLMHAPLQPFEHAAPSHHSIVNPGLAASEPRSEFDGSRQRRARLPVDRARFPFGRSAPSAFGSVATSRSGHTVTFSSTG